MISRGLRQDRIMGRRAGSRHRPEGGRVRHSAAPRGPAPAERPDRFRSRGERDPLTLHRWPHPGHAVGHRRAAPAFGLGGVGGSPDAGRQKGVASGPRSRIEHGGAYTAGKASRRGARARPPATGPNFPSKSRFFPNRQRSVEVAGLVAAVAERLPARVPAPTQGIGPSVGRRLDRVPLGIREGDASFDSEGSVLSNDDLRVGQASTSWVCGWCENFDVTPPTARVPSLRLTSGRLRSPGGGSERPAPLRSHSVAHRLGAPRSVQ